MARRVSLKTTGAVDKLLHELNKGKAPNKVLGGAVCLSRTVFAHRRLSTFNVFGTHIRTRLPRQGGSYRFTRLAAITEF